MEDLGLLPVYAAMLGATVVGQFLGAGLDAALLGQRVLWVPVACSLLLEALVGAYYGAARLGRPLTWGDSGRISGTYSLALVCGSLPLAGWLSASGHLAVPRSSPSSTPVAVAIAVAAALALAYTALRSLVMRLLPKRRTR
jgi:hypothetical protein